MALMSKQTAAAMAAWLLLALQPVHAQEGADETVADPRAQDPAWHSAQQIYLLGLTPEDGWHFVDGGLRWRLSGGHRSAKSQEFTPITEIDSTNFAERGSSSGPQGGEQWR